MTIIHTTLGHGPGSTCITDAFNSMPTKGQSWSDEEHLSFLRGLQAFGKGQWKQISRVYVPCRTPTQVASHAQKHFLRCAGQTNKARRSRFVDVESRALASGLVSNVTGGSNRYPPTTGTSSISITTGTPTPPILPGDNNDNNKQQASSSSWQAGGGDAHLAPLLPLQLAPCPIIAASSSGEARIIDGNTKGVDEQAVVQQPQPHPSSSSGPQPQQPKQQQPTLAAINNTTDSEDYQSKSYSEWINCPGNNNNSGSEGCTQSVPPPAIIFEGRKLPVLPVRPGRINATSSTSTTGSGAAMMMMMPVGSQQYRNGSSHGGAAVATATTSGNLGVCQVAVKKVRTSTRVSQRKSRLATKAAEGGGGGGSNSNRARNSQLFRLLELQERLTHSSASHQLSGNDDDDDDDMVVDDDGYYYYDKVGLPVTSRKAVVKGNEDAVMDLMMGDEMIHTNDVGTGNGTGKRHKSNGYNGHAVPSSVTPPPPNRQNGGSLYASSSGDFSNGSNSALDALAAAAALEQGCSDDDEY